MRKYIRSFGVLASGQGFAALLPLVTAPILGRLYTPAEYAIVIALIALASIPSVAATLQLHQGILVEADPNAETAIAALALVTTIATTALSVAFVGLAIAALPPAFTTGNEVGSWLLVLPLATLQAGLAAISVSLAIRPRHYHFISFSQALPAVVTASVSIFLGLKGASDWGLIFGYVAGLAVQIAMHCCYIVKRLVHRRLPTLPELRAARLRHRRFSLFSLPSELLLSATSNAPVYALSFLGFGAATGDFGRARQISSIAPNAVIGAAGHIFRGEALADLEARGDCRRVVSNTALTLFALGLAGAAPIWFFAPDLFAFYLGPSWRGAGEMAQILIPMLVLRMAVSPVSTIFWLVGAQRRELVLSTFSVIVMIGGLYIGYRWTDTAKGLVMGYSISYAITYAVTYAQAFRLASESRSFDRSKGLS